MTREQKSKRVLQYKGFGINFIRGQYRAEAYANPSFYDTNLERLKKQIRDYLK